MITDNAVCSDGYFSTEYPSETAVTCDTDRHKVQ